MVQQRKNRLCWITSEGFFVNTKKAEKNINPSHWNTLKKRENRLNQLFFFLLLNVTRTTVLLTRIAFPWLESLQHTNLDSTCPTVSDKVEQVTTNNLQDALKMKLNKEKSWHETTQPFSRRNTRDRWARLLICLHRKNVIDKLSQCYWFRAQEWNLERT